MSHVTHVNDVTRVTFCLPQHAGNRQRENKVISRICMRHVTHMNQPCHTHGAINSGSFAKIDLKSYGSLPPCMKSHNYQTQGVHYSTLELGKEDMKFSAAHYTVFSGVWLTIIFWYMADIADIHDSYLIYARHALLIFDIFVTREWCMFDNKSLL